MVLSHSQRAMIYLVAHGLKIQDFQKIIDIKPQRASQLLNWRNTIRPIKTDEKKRWRAATCNRVLQATNGGLDVESEIWTKIERLLDKMPSPSTVRVDQNS